jgi:6-phosphogluconolactonase (cycloisomerase 2 family)
MKRVAFAALALLACSVLISPGLSHAQLSLVYFESNIGSVDNQNSIYAYSNVGGHLTAVPGSPFLTGGTGVYDPGGLSTSFDADQQIIINKAGTLLFAVNGHTNNISVFNIQADGSLVPVAGSPFDSGGTDPVSLSLDEVSGFQVGKVLLAVANKSADPNQIDAPPNYTTFFVDSSGTLTPTGNTVELALGSVPSQVILHPSGHLMISNEFQAGMMSTYRYNASGALTYLDSVSPPLGGNFLGLALNPIQSVLYAGTPSPTKGKNYMSTYKYAPSTGAFSFQNTVRNQGEATCWITVNAAGTRYYDSETVSNTVSAYKLTPPTNPVFQQQITLPVGGTPLNLTIDPTQKFLYVLQAKGVKETDSRNRPPAGDTVQGKLVVLNIASDGSLSGGNPSIQIVLPTGETPVGLATLMK